MAFPASRSADVHRGRRGNARRLRRPADCADCGSDLPAVCEQRQVRPLLRERNAAAGRSRVVGGIHYPVDIVGGQTLGRSVADWAIAYDAQPGGLLRAIP